MRLRVMLVWSGAVNPSYRGFFNALARELDVIVVSPAAWKHGSVVFIDDTATQDTKASYQRVITRFWGAGTQGGSFYCIPAWPRLVSKHRPDLIYWMDEPDRMTTWLHLAWAKLQTRLLGHKPALVPGVRVCAYKLQNLPRPSYYRLHHRLSLGLSHACLDGLIAATREAATVAKQQGWHGPTSVIPLFADAEELTPPTPAQRLQARASLGLDDSDYVLAYAGSLHAAKGLPCLIQALASLPRVRLLVASGDAWSEAWAYRPHRHLGALRGRDLLRLYHAADAVILASETQTAWKEQVGRILIEGVLAGCLALGSDSGAIPEVVGEPRLVFRAGQVDALRQLLQALPLPDTAELKARQYRRIVRGYSDSAVAQATRDFFQDLASA